MRLSIIVAAADNGVIGQKNRLPWHLSADLKRFKALTMGHHLLIGRKTFQSIGRALPGRTTVVLSRGTPDLPAGVHLAANLDTAIDIARRAGDSEAFVAGGAAVYREALAKVERLYLTRILGEFEGDTHFPAWDTADWRLVSLERCQSHEGEPSAVFEVWERA